MFVKLIIGPYSYLLLTIKTLSSLYFFVSSPCENLQIFLGEKPSIANKERTWTVTSRNVYKISGLEKDWWERITMKVWCLCVYSYSNLHVIQIQIKLWQYSIKAYHIFFSRRSCLYLLCLIWCRSSAYLGASFSHIQQKYKTSY